MFKLCIKDQCRKRGFTLSKLADRCGIPQPSLSRYETGKSDITLRQLSRICLVLGLNVSDLLEKEVFTEKYAKEIVKVERTAVKADKAWVGKVQSDLLEHYRGTRR
ncbi:MAG: helix-turn-helix domain-containing protein [Planctomycetota bacterium]|jgi:transcriptional regulator with XRE-family HTH domain